jgi:carboxypeptidase D
VKSIPQVNFSVPKSWAGSLKIGAGFGDDSLFFWLWEAETLQGKDDLIIWFNGGPACSSLTGLFKIHGPVTFPKTATKPQRNPYSWTRGANIVYVDQPIGTGFSTGTSGDGTNNADNTAAVVKWLDSFFTTLPNMRSKNIHLMGESYAGVFLPYIAQAVQAQKATLNVKLSSLSLGDSLWGNMAGMGNVAALSYIAEHRSNYGTQM